MARAAKIALFTRNHLILQSIMSDEEQPTEGKSGPKGGLCKHYIRQQLFDRGPYYPEKHGLGNRFAIVVAGFTGCRLCFHVVEAETLELAAPSDIFCTKA